MVDFLSSRPLSLALSLSRSSPMRWACSRMVGITFLEAMDDHDIHTVKLLSSNNSLELPADVTPLVEHAVCKVLLRVERFRNGLQLRRLSEQTKSVLYQLTSLRTRVIS